MSEHTPLPWHIGILGADTVIWAMAQNADTFRLVANLEVDWAEERKAKMGVDGIRAEIDANADLIINAVNSYDDLMVALQAALDHEGHEDGKCGCCWTDKARAAIAKAKGVQR